MQRRSGIKLICWHVLKVIANLALLAAVVLVAIPFLIAILAWEAMDSL